MNGIFQKFFREVRSVLGGLCGCSSSITVILNVFFLLRCAQLHDVLSKILKSQRPSI